MQGFLYLYVLYYIVGVDVLGDPNESKLNGTPGRSSPTKTRQGGAICKNSAVLFTFYRFYGIIQLIDKLEFDEQGAFVMMHSVIL